MYDNKFGHNRGVHVIYASQKSSNPKRASSEQGISKTDHADPVFYREVDLSDFPQDIPRTLNLGSFFNCPVPRDSMAGSSSSLDSDVAGQQELRPKGPSAILPSVLNLRCLFNLEDLRAAS